MNYLIGIIALAVAFGSGWSVNGWRLDATYQSEQKTALEGVIHDRDAALHDRDALADKLAASDDAHALQLRKAQDETNSLRDRVSSGRVGLRVAATCPGPAESPSTPTAPGVDHGTAPELDPDARQTYFALRDGIDRTVAQLTACQGELALRQ